MNLRQERRGQQSAGESKMQMPWNLCWSLVVVQMFSWAIRQEAAPARLLSTAAMSVIANTCVNLADSNTELKRLDGDFPTYLFLSLFSLLVPWQGEVDSGSVSLFETNRLEDIWSGLSETPLCIHVRKTKWNFPLIQKLKAARLYFSKRN